MNYHARRPRPSRQPKEWGALRIEYPTWKADARRSGPLAGRRKVHCPEKGGVLK